MFWALSGPIWQSLFRKYFCGNRLGELPPQPLSDRRLEDMKKFRFLKKSFGPCQAQFRKVFSANSFAEIGWGASPQPLSDLRVEDIEKRRSRDQDIYKIRRLRRTRGPLRSLPVRKRDWGVSKGGFWLLSRNPVEMSSPEQTPARSPFIKKKCYNSGT